MTGPLSPHEPSPHSAQRGRVDDSGVVGIAALLRIAGLALEMGHCFLNKKRLQNTVDAAALAAAKVLDQTADEGLATAEAMQMFDEQRGGTAATANSASVRLRRRREHHAWNIRARCTRSSRALPAAYVRVRASEFKMPSGSARVGGIDKQDRRVGASRAQADHQPGLCNVMPMMVCGDPAAARLTGATRRSARGAQMEHPDGHSEVGPGNFQLIRLGSGHGRCLHSRSDGRRLRRLHREPASNDRDQPGNQVGPVAQGLQHAIRSSTTGPMSGQQATYPPDVIVDGHRHPRTSTRRRDGQDHDRSGRRSSMHDNSISTTRTTRDPRESRELRQPAVPERQWRVRTPRGRRYRSAIATARRTAQGEVSLLGFACFFLLHRRCRKATSRYIYGQFVEDCCGTACPGPIRRAAGSVHHSALPRSCEQRLMTMRMKNRAASSARHRDGRVRDHAHRLLLLLMLGDAELGRLSYRTARSRRRCTKAPGTRAAAPKARRASSTSCAGAKRDPQPGGQRQHQRRYGRAVLAGLLPAQVTRATRGQRVAVDAQSTPTSPFRRLYRVRSWCLDQSEPARDASCCEMRSL